MLSGLAGRPEHLAVPALSSVVPSNDIPGLFKTFMSENDPEFPQPHGRKFHSTYS